MFDIIISNPPYIKLNDYKSMAKKILQFSSNKYKKKIYMQPSLDKYSYKKNCNEYYKLINRYL